MNTVIGAKTKTLIELVKTIEHKKTYAQYLVTIGFNNRK